MPKILKVKDKSDKNVIDKGLLPDVSFRGVICMRTGGGKGNIITNLFLNPDFYLHDFHGTDIFIFSPLVNDNKMNILIEQKEIPEENLHTEVDYDILNGIYEDCLKEFEMRTAMGKPIFQKVFLFDDVSFDGQLRKGGNSSNIINKIYCNGRKHGISIITTLQYYNQVSPTCKANSSFMIIGDQSDRNLDSVAEDHNFLGGKNSKKSFKKMFRDTIQEKHDFMVMCYSNKKSDRYLDTDFNVIDYKQYET
tara:strand:+ start:145 stop:894 length:750 start_codon:yes stop_codon:yes gene_type:complete